MRYFYGYYMPNYNAMNQDSQLTWSEIVDKNFNMTNEDNQLSWSEIVDRNFNMKNPLLECEDSRIIGSESNNYKYTAAKCTNGIIPENYNGYNDGYGFQGQLCPTYESHSEAYSPTIEDPAVYNSNSNYPQVIQQPGLYGVQNVANCAMNTFSQQCVPREIVPLENDNFFGVNNNVSGKTEELRSVEPLSIVEDDYATYVTCLFKQEKIVKSTKSQSSQFYSSSSVDIYNKKGCKVLGDFCFTSVNGYGDILCIIGEYKLNEQSRGNFKLVLTNEQYTDGDIVGEMRKQGVLCFNINLSNKELNRYVCELIRKKLCEKGPLPKVSGFAIWNEKDVFVSQEFFQKDNLPVIVTKSFDSQTTLTFEECGMALLNIASRTSNRKLFMAINVIRILGIVSSVISECDIKFNKAVFLDGDFELLEMLLQVYDREKIVHHGRSINTQEKEFNLYFNNLKDDVLILTDSNNDSKYKKGLGQQNLQKLSQALVDNYNGYTNNNYLFCVLSDCLGQQIREKEAFLLNASDLRLNDVPCNELISTVYNFDKKIVNRICSEKADFKKRFTELFLFWRDKSDLRNELNNDNMLFTSILLAMTRVIYEFFSFVSNSVVSYTEMEIFLKDLAKKSEISCCEGQLSKEFTIVFNDMVSKEEIDLLVHSQLSKAVASRECVPPVFCDSEYLYFTEEAFNKISEKIKLSATPCAVRKALDESHLLKSGCDLQTQVTLYDRFYDGRQYVTALKRTLINDENLLKINGGVFNFFPCIEHDNARILIGIDDAGKNVFISSNHPDLTNKHILIMGDSGTGKSTAGNIIALARYMNGENVIYLDFSNSNSKNKMLSHGFSEEFYDDNIECIEINDILTEEELKRILLCMQQNHKIIVFRTRKYDQNTEDFLSLLYDLIVYDEDMNTTLIIDEIHELTYGKGSALSNIMEKGRGNGISLISILQAPHELKPKQLSILNQSAVKLIFGLNDGDDGKACVDKLGLKPAHLFVKLIGDLPKKKCLVVGNLEDVNGEMCTKRYSRIEVIDCFNEQQNYFLDLKY